MKNIFLLGLVCMVSGISHSQISRTPLNVVEYSKPAFNYDQLAFGTSILNYSNPDEVLRLERLEVGITLPLKINQQVLNFTENVLDSSAVKINPYLEWELKVEAFFIHENDTLHPIVIDGFFLKKYTSWMMNPLPEPKNGESYGDQEYSKTGGWREVRNHFPFQVRFAPPETGNWQYYVKITTPDLMVSSKPMSFSVVESNNKGYVSVNENGRFLELNNKTFYPVGVNAQWPETYREFDPEFYKYNIMTIGGVQYYRPELYRNTVCVPRAYEKYKEVLGKMNDQGLNYFRAIMNPISTEIEWETLGNYTQRLPQAQEMDEILEFAEERGMYIHWNMAIHNTFKYNVYSIVYWDWIDNDGTKSYAYKSAFNLNHPTEFFTHEEARKYYKQRLRYILSRWGYSTNIAVFELMSEISNIGSEGDNNNDYYFKNHQVYEDWQREMGAYIQSFYYGAKHLLSASYSGEKHRQDATFAKEGAYDVMTSNIYDFGEPDFSGFFNKFVSRRFLNENPEKPGDNVYTMDCTGEGKNRNCEMTIKPMVFAETEPVEMLQNCHRSPIELNRSMWQSLFSGLAASIPWSSWYYTDNYAIYGQMHQFISSIDAGDENWHPGASRLVMRDSLATWEYNAAYADKMNLRESKADLAYLRSGNLDAAIGVISNKTYNVYNADTCLTIPLALKHLEIRQPVFPVKEDLQIRGLKKARYRIEYFLPENQDEPIFISEQKGSSLDIDLPFISPTKEGFIVLFRVSEIKEKR